MSHFCLLSDSTSYVPLNWDLLTDEPTRKHWLDLFDNHFAHAMKHASAHYGRVVNKPVAAAAAEFSQAIAQLRENPASLPSGKLDMIELCRLRERILRKHKLNDPYKQLKDRENASAMKLYSQVVRKVHSLNHTSKWQHLIGCVFAGNLFDKGSSATAYLADESTDFIETLEKTQPRPWLVDDFDRLAADLPAAAPLKWFKAVVFIDNAGSDFILGVMPLVREMALMGTRIVLAANELPSLNDMTVNETERVVAQLATIDLDLDALIQAGMFEVVSSGSDIPLIDLSNVSDELNAASADADMVILEGMGRAIESNFDASFKVDTLKLALLKDPVIAQRLGGELLDCVCKYEPAPAAI